MNRVEKHIDVLDGVRAVSIAFVAWFHFWQQSWVTPYITIPNFFKVYLGITEINLEGFVRHGYIFVDLMILLSAVCNFYTYARAILLEEPWPDTIDFYKRRFIRIMPSYFLAVAVMLIIAICEHKYWSMGFLVKDVLVHLFCVKTFFHDAMAYSPINAVLWTVQIEVLYYLLMPWIAKLFRKAPLMTCMGLWICTVVSSRFFLVKYADSIMYYNINMLSYACYYANGFLICMLYIKFKQGERLDIYGSIASTILFLVGIWILNQMVHTLGGQTPEHGIQAIQLELRFGMSFVYSMLLLALMTAPKWIRAVFSNRVFSFLSIISYQFYIWHQFIACKLKELRIPYWEGDTPPNMLGDMVWGRKYQLIVILVSLLVATVLTYGFEIPVAKTLRKRLLSRPNENADGNADGLGE